MKPTNTTAEAHADAFATLLRTGLPGGIEAQEARGQRELVKSESLPTDCQGREALEAAGVKFGAPYPDDKLFCDAVLPEGWKKQATDHSMWSNLVDAKGRLRARIFYKAAHYDRRADMYAERRYSMSVFEDGSDSNHRRAVVKDGETTIHDLGEYRSGDYDKSRELETAATNWLNEHFPDWKSVAAYWD